MSTGCTRPQSTSLLLRIRFHRTGAGYGLMGIFQRAFHAPKPGKIQRPTMSGGLREKSRDLAAFHSSNPVDLTLLLISTPRFNPRLGEHSSWSKSLVVKEGAVAHSFPSLLVWCLRKDTNLGMWSKRMEPGESVDGNSIWHVQLSSGLAEPVQIEYALSRFVLSFGCPVIQLQG